jgi:tryptophanyl-tRNA synthetase
LFWWWGGGAACGEQIKKYAFSGGQETLEEHRAKGGNCDIDVAYQYLSFFMDDDAELERIRVVRACVRIPVQDCRCVDARVGYTLHTYVCTVCENAARAGRTDRCATPMCAVRRVDPQEYTSGRMLTGELKGILIKVLQELVAAHQKARAAVTDEMVEAFMAMRRMRF